MRLTLRVPLRLLKGQQDDLVTLLRLGAGVNAVESSSRLILKLGPAPSEVDQLSRMLCVCNGLASFRELVTTIQKANYLDRLLELAAKGLAFSPVHVSLDKGRELLSPEHPDAGGNSLSRLRNKVTFHWDPEPFRALLTDSDGRVIDVWTISGEPPDRMFTASAYAIAQHTLETSSQTAEGFMELFLDAVTVVGHVLESAFIGLLIEAGETDPRKYFVKETEPHDNDERGRR